LNRTVFEWYELFFQQHIKKVIHLLVPTLWHGDCLDLLTRISDSSVDAIIHDPPYGTTQCNWDVALNLDRLWAQFKRIIKPTGVILIFAAQPFTSRLIISQPELYRYIWYWEKEKGTNFFRTGFQPLRVIEEIVVFSPGANYTYHPQMVLLNKPYTHTMPLQHSAITGSGRISVGQTEDDREYKTYTHSHPTNLLKFARPAVQKVPTQKPIDLLKYMIRTYTNSGDLVLDPTMGSGSCGGACAHLQRQFHGIEIDRQHFDLARQYIELEYQISSVIKFN
jgi:DNA modification methylase